MSTTLKNLMITLGCAFLCVGSTTFADSCDPGCEPSCCDSCWGNFSAYGEWLYLRPCADGIYIALQGELSNKTFPAEDNNAKVSVKGFDFELSSGFRLGFGYSNYDCSCWDVTLDWTYYSPSHDQKVKVKAPGGPRQYLFPFFCEDFLFSSLNVDNTDARENLIDTQAENGTEVKADWDLDSHVVDLTFSFPFCLNECFELNPHFGLRYAHVDQRLTSKSLFINAGNETNILCQKYDSTFNGVGPRGGFGATWHLGCGFGIYGDLALTIAYGETCAGYRNSFQSLLVTGVPQSDFFLNKYRADSDTCCSRVISDTGIGVYWSNTFCDCVETKIRLGWEHHVFFNQGVADGVGGCLILTKEESGDLSTQGVVLGFGIEF